jgi:hypothetical protein
MLLDNEMNRLTAQAPQNHRLCPSDETLGAGWRLRSLGFGRPMTLPVTSELPMVTDWSLKARTRKAAKFYAW